MEGGNSRIAEPPSSLRLKGDEAFSNQGRFLDHYDIKSSGVPVPEEGAAPGGGTS
jgi:hypothetical protein